MGWNIKITTNKTVYEPILDQVLRSLRMTFKPHGGRQEWGWSEAVDVRRPNRRRIELSGAYSISGNIADNYADSLTELLKERGFKVRRWKMT